jgi:hypothetical protein
MYCLPSGNYVVTVSKLTTQSSSFLCSYLTLTSNILLTTLLTLILNPVSSLDIWNQISQPHKISGTMSDLQMRTWKIPNWTVASIAWTCCFYRPKIMFLLTFCQNLTYLNPDSQQSGSFTSQEICHKIQTTPDMTIRTVHNPFFTVQLSHEYKLPNKPETLTPWSRVLLEKLTGFQLVKKFSTL